MGNSLSDPRPAHPIFRQLRSSGAELAGNPTFGQFRGPSRPLQNKSAEAGAIEKCNRLSSGNPASRTALTMTQHTVLKLSLAAASMVTPVPFAQSPSIPQWQRAVGTKMSFEVASIRQRKSGAELSNNGEMDFSDAFPPTGGLLTTTSSLVGYIIFAYKIVDASQIPSLVNQLPNWAQTDEFDIQARAENHNPTKDQMRLMMQSLLADRFKLAIHIETRQLPVYALVLDKPGKPGPQLQPHPDDVPCTDRNKPAPAVSGSEPPSFCGARRLGR
jgi:hypothetical protein